MSVKKEVFVVTIDDFIRIFLSVLLKGYEGEKLAGSGQFGVNIYVVRYGEGRYKANERAFLTFVSGLFRTMKPSGEFVFKGKRYYVLVEAGEVNRYVYVTENPRDWTDDSYVYFLAFPKAFFLFRFERYVSIDEEKLKLMEDVKEIMEVF